MFEFLAIHFQCHLALSLGFGYKPPLYGVERGLGVSTFFKPLPPGARLTGVRGAGKRERGSLINKDT